MNLRNHSKLGLFLSISLLIFLILALVEKSSSSHGILIVGSATLPWVKILYPLQWVIYQFTGFKTNLGFEIFQIICVLINIFCAYWIGKYAAINKRSVTGIILFGLFSLLVVAFLIYIFTAGSSMSLSGVLLVLLGEPWVFVIGSNGIWVGILLNAVFIYSIGSSFSYFINKVWLFIKLRAG